MKLSLTTKIFLAFALMLATFAAIAFFSVREFHALGEDLRGINDGHLVLARLAGQLETHQQNRFRDLRRGLAEQDPASQEVVLRIATAYFPDVVQSRVAEVREVCARQILRLPPNDEEHGLKRSFYGSILENIELIGRQNEVVDELTEALLAQVRTGSTSAALLSEIDRLENELRGHVYQLNKRIDEETDRAVRRAERDERNAVWRVIALTLLAIFVGLLLTFLSSRALAPINALVAFARAISRGDYERRVDVRGDDELSALAEELELMSLNRKERELELDRQQDELERAYHRVADLKHYHESVVQSLKTAVIVTDRALQVTSTNRAVETLLQLVDSEVRGRALSDLPIGQALLDRLGSLDTLVAGSSVVRTASVPLEDKLFDVSVAPLQSDAGGVLGLVVAAQDVTDAVRTKEALIRSERLAAIGRMSAHVTHEIRNPLSSIGLNAEMLESEFGEGQAQRLCRAIIREVDRLTAITEEYLRFARLPRPELRRESPVRLLQNIAAFVSADCAAAGVEITQDIAEDMPAIHIDPDQLRQALLNLVRNAKESMPEGGQIILRATHDDERATISVRDHGGGIDAKDLEHIFDPFYSTKLTGTGLGLALVQQIVTEHGGHLEVRSDPGEGTEVLLRMPRAQEAEITGFSTQDDEPPLAADG